MKCRAFSVLWLAVLAAPAGAHFVWLVPGKAAEGKTTARLFLSEGLTPEGPEFLDSIAKAEVFACDADGKTLPLRPAKSNDAFTVTVPTSGSRVIGAVCPYGVMQRGDTPAFLLNYYAKTIVGPVGPGKAKVGSPRLLLEILSPEETGMDRYQVIWQGKPLKDADVVILAGGAEQKAKTGADGTFRFTPEGSRAVGIRARHIETKSGETGGKKYASVGHYATLVLNADEAAAAGTKPASAQTDSVAVAHDVAFEARDFVPLATPVSSFGAAVVGDWLYLYGGHRAAPHQYSTEAVTGGFQRVSLSNPAKCEPLASGPALQGLALVAHDGKLYRVGGMQPRNTKDQPTDDFSVATCACFDPATGRWEPLADLPVPRSSHDAVVVGDKLVVVGGWKMSGAGTEPEFQTDALVLDLKQRSAKWQSIKQPFRRRALTAVVRQGKVYVFGGLTPKDGPALTVDVFDPASGDWSAGPNIPGPALNGFAPASAVVGETVYLSPADGRLLRLSSKGDSWEKVGSLQRPRLVHRLVAAADDTLVAVGGASRKGNIAMAEALVRKRPTGNGQPSSRSGNEAGQPSGDSSSRR